MRMNKMEEMKRNKELRRIQEKRIKELYKYTEEYSGDWEEQQNTILDEKIRSLKEWDKKKRMDKIKILKEKYNH